MHCVTCNLTFKTKANYTKHLKTQRHLKRVSNESTIFTCVCGKSYSYHQSLYVHRKTCEQHKSSKNNTTIIDAMQQRLDKYEKDTQEMKDQYEKEREEMKAQISLLLDKQAGNTTTNSNNTNIETQHNNNITININAFGNENTEYIDDQAILQCIDRVYKSIPALLQKIHFDPQHPENHNIKITNKKLPYASVMGNNQKWKTIDRKDAIDKMVTNGYYMLDEKYEVNKDKFDPRKQKNFEGFKDKFETEEKATMKMVKGDVEMLVINEGES
jgi:hypothetical protein